MDVPLTGLVILTVGFVVGCYFLTQLIFKGVCSLVRICYSRYQTVKNRRDSGKRSN